METIASSSRYSKPELKRINGYRLCLQVTTLSDITAGNGQCVSNCIWNGHKDQTRSIGDHDWPRAGTPTQNELKL